MPVQLIALVIIVYWVYQSAKIFDYFILAAVLCGVYIGSVSLFPNDQPVQKERAPMVQYRACNAMLNYMLQSGKLEKIVDLKGKVVWANNNTAPLFLYWTDAYTVGSNFTHNVEGIVDSMELYTTTDDAEFKNLLKKRKTDYVIACLYRDKAAYKTVMNKLALSVNGDHLGIKAVDYRMSARPQAIQVEEDYKPRIYKVVN